VCPPNIRLIIDGHSSPAYSSDRIRTKHHQTGPPIKPPAVFETLLSRLHHQIYVGAHFHRLDWCLGGVACPKLSRTVPLARQSRAPHDRHLLGGNFGRFEPPPFLGGFCVPLPQGYHGTCFAGMELPSHKGRHSSYISSPPYFRVPRSMRWQYPSHSPFRRQRPRPPPARYLTVMMPRCLPRTISTLLSTGVRRLRPCSTAISMGPRTRHRPQLARCISAQVHIHPLREPTRLHLDFLWRYRLDHPYRGSIP